MFLLTRRKTSACVYVRDVMHTFADCTIVLIYDCINENANWTYAIVLNLNAKYFIKLSTYSIKYCSNKNTTFGS